MSDQHTPGTDRAAIAVLKELKLYEQASAGCIAMLSITISRETAATDMLAALKFARDQLAALQSGKMPAGSFARTIRTMESAIALGERR